MSETKPQSTPPVNVEGDAVINQAPDGGGIDNQAAAAVPEQAGTSADGEAGSD